MFLHQCTPLLQNCALFLLILTSFSNKCDTNRQSAFALATIAPNNNIISRQGNDISTLSTSRLFQVIPQGGSSIDSINSFESNGTNQQLNETVPITIPYETPSPLINSIDVDNTAVHTSSEGISPKNIVNDATETHNSSSVAFASRKLFNPSKGELRDDLDVSRLSEMQKYGPLKVLFLSADTGGGHRASAESLANQFTRLFPGSTCKLMDVWTPTRVFPYFTLVKAYQHLSNHPFQWKMLYYASNTRAYEKFTDIHSSLTCSRKIKHQMAAYDPDVVISVHPTMNFVPMKVTRKISESKGKYIPFFTVVTDFGSGHCTWFQKGIDKMFIASDRIRKLAKKRGNVPDEKMVMSGLPIRYDFALEAEKMGDRTSESGKDYRRMMKEKLGLNPNKKMILVMGGGEGVGSLEAIADALHSETKRYGIDATICVVCGRNENLRNQLGTKDWENTKINNKQTGKRRFFSKLLSKKNRISTENDSVEKVGKVNVIGLGFVSNMAEYMVGADVLVSKAGPGTIAEAASVGLPVMVTSFLPGQEAGNVDIVLDGEFGAYYKDPKEGAQEVARWLNNSLLLDVMSQKSAAIGHPNAASEIVQEIGQVTHSLMNQ